MTEAGAEEFAEFGAAALDSFQALFEQTEHLDHRTNDQDARELIGDLLIDLMHYTQRRGLEFNDIVAQAQAYYDLEQDDTKGFAIGSTVQLEGPAADEAILLGRPTRGSVTGVFVSHQGQTEYYVRFLGQAKNQPVLAADLEPAPPLPATATTTRAVNDPLDAEQLLLETATRIALAEVHGNQPSRDDLSDHRTLLDALTAWNGMSERNVTDLLLSRIADHLEATDPDNRSTVRQPAAEPTPAQLAAEAFPMPLSGGVTDEPEPPAPRSPSRQHKPPGLAH